MSHLIHSAVQDGSWVPLKIARGGPELSHLFFADDMVLFGEASTKQMQVMLNCLNIFCNISGQKVNFSKSSLYVSRNVENSLANQLSSMSGIPLTTDLGMYLGMPSLHGRITNSSFKHVLDRVAARLAGWKAKSLSFAGRATLVQSVITSIPCYSMQTVALPISVCKEVERMARSFLWGNNEQVRKTSLINWKTVSMPKAYGGLGNPESSTDKFSFSCKVRVAFDYRT